MVKRKRQQKNFLTEADLEALENLVNKIFFKRAAEQGYGHEWVRLNDKKAQNELKGWEEVGAKVGIKVKI